MSGAPSTTDPDGGVAAYTRLEDVLAKRREIQIGITHVRDNLRQLGVALPDVPSDLAHWLPKEIGREG